MNKDIIFLNPVCTHNIWGGTRLNREFGYPIEGDDIGECWGISAHPSGDGTVASGAYKGMKLSELWEKHPGLFGDTGMDRFPPVSYTHLTPVDKRQFVGFRNYIDVFKKDECFSALKLSLYYMAGAMVQLVLALYLATILSFKTKFGNMFKGFMFFPYLISGIAIGFIFKFFYTRGFVFDTVLQLSLIHIFTETVHM